MAKLNYEAVKKSIAAKDFKNIYYIYGADTVSVEKLTSMLIKTFVKSGDEDFSLSRFEGDDLRFDELYESLERVPFFAPYNCVLIKNLNADALAGGVFPDLMKKLETLSNSATVLIISITGFDVLFGKKAPVKNNKKLIDFCEKSGVVCCCEQKTPVALAEIAIKRFEKNGCTISKKDALYLAELCLCDSAMLENEIEKISHYVQSGNITCDVIDELTPRTLSADVFGVARAIGAINAKKTFSLLADVFDKNTDEVAVCATLISAFVDLYRAKCAMSFSKSAETVAADFDMNNRVFAVKNNMRDCKSMSLKHLAFCLDVLRKTDLELKSTNANKRILVEKAVTQMLMVKND